MAITFRKLFELYSGGFFPTEYNKDMPPVTMTICGEVIDRERAKNLCAMCGWTEMVLDPFEILYKTGKACKGMHKHITNDDFLDNTLIAFENKTTSLYNQYGKTCDRYLIESRSPRNPFRLTVIYGLPNGRYKASKYEVYNSNSHQLATHESINSLKQLAVFLNNYHG